MNAVVTLGLAVAVLLSTSYVSAEPPARASTGTPATTSAVADVELFEEIPGLLGTFASQWTRRDAPRGLEDVHRDWSGFGLLRETRTRHELPLALAIELALRNNTDLQIQRLGPVGARAEVRRALSIFDPSFFADLTVQRDVRPSSFTLETSTVPDQRSFTATGGLRKKFLSGADVTFAWVSTRSKSNSALAGLVPEYRTEFQLSLNQPLLRDFGLSFTTLLVRIARTAEERAVYEYEALVADVVERVEEAYWRLVEAKENVRVVEQGLAAARELLRQNEGKYKVGTLPKAAVLAAQAEVARREADLIAARNAVRVARDNLRALVNVREKEGEPLLMIEPADRPTVEPYEIDFERSLAAAREKRPELRAAQLEVKERAMQLKIAENQLLPRLNAIGSVGTNGLSGKAQPRQFGDVIAVNPFDGPFSEALNRAVGGEFYSFSAGVTLELPIGNGFAKADYARARVDLEAARRLLRKRQEAVTLEVKTAITQLQNALESIEARRVARKLAEENLRDQQARYEVGLATTKDILDFQDDLTQARAAETAALIDYRIRLAALRRAEGTLLEARNIVVERGPEEKPPWWARF
ncbi:MAG: hypothetical protein KatS3mg076_1433 [Candidatus Binatia bacterium]|nr:MAG: hypothetical protein KatS3mg076_1433 [Candidatus Binatia bacterium]